jgi:hypothetical protein
VSSENPPTPVDTPAATNSPPIFSLTEIGKKTGEWTLTLLPSHLALADAPGAQPYVILREQIMKTVVVMEATRALVVQQPQKLVFKLTPEGMAALADWIGKPFLAAFYLKRRYAWVSVWALLWVGGSLTTLITPARDGSGPHFELFGFLLGLTLLAASAFARWRPHSILFLVDSLWFCTVAVQLTVSITQGRSKGWYLVVIILVVAAVSGFKKFFRFRGIKLAPLPK